MISTCSQLVTPVRTGVCAIMTGADVAALCANPCARVKPGAKAKTSEPEENAERASRARIFFGARSHAHTGNEHTRGPYRKRSDAQAQPGARSAEDCREESAVGDDAVGQRPAASPGTALAGLKTPAHGTKMMPTSPPVTAAFTPFSARRTSRSSRCKRRSFSAPPAQTFLRRHSQYIPLADRH